MVLGTGKPTATVMRTAPWYHVKAGMMRGAAKRRRKGLVRPAAPSPGARRKELPPFGSPAWRKLFKLGKGKRR